MYHDHHVVIIPLHEPEATGRRSPLQVMKLALMRIGADEQSTPTTSLPQSQQSDHE